MNRDELHTLLDDCIDHATDADMDVLKGALDGIRTRQEMDSETYFGHMLHYKDELKNDDSLQATLPVSPLVMNNIGAVHGGFIATLADTAMGTLIARTLPEGKACVTAELKINYLRPALDGELNCEATVLHRGSRTTVTSCEITRDDGKKCAFATATFFIIDRS